jgi:hypothetical protein
VNFANGALRLVGQRSLSWLRRVADAEELVTVGQLWFAALVVLVVVIAGAAGLGFSWRVFQWAS